LKNEPLQHIIGSTYFCDLKLLTDKRALIPRPETEELVYHIVEWVKSKDNNPSAILDLCTGSGCIALALKSFFPQAIIAGTDISNDALLLAKENSENTGMHVHFFQSDVLNFNLPKEELPEKYDVIVSNPPYIPFSDLIDMDANVIYHEPHLALFVENDNPLIFYRKIGELALKYLKPKGLLAFEIHEKHERETKALLESQGFINVTLLTDLQGKNRMVFTENV
jgi:release factor glutamine methyltransferase